MTAPVVPYAARLAGCSSIDQWFRCWRKSRFDDYYLALDACRKTERRSSLPVGSLHVYACSYCGEFHTGHPIRAKNRARWADTSLWFVLGERVMAHGKVENSGGETQRIAHLTHRFQKAHAKRERRALRGGS